MADLHTIVYASSAVRLFSDIELESLLAEARQLNRLHSITGVLLYADGNFMQCIEGAEKDVAATYERICASKRHKDVTDILQMPINSRHFSSWEMGFSKPGKTELLTLSDAISTAKALHDSPAPAIGLELLKSFLINVRG